MKILSIAFEFEGKACMWRPGKREQQVIVDNGTPEMVATLEGIDLVLQNLVDQVERNYAGIEGTSNGHSSDEAMELEHGEAAS